jgi:hypothetical protein
VRKKGGRPELGRIRGGNKSSILLVLFLSLSFICLFVLVGLCFFSGVWFVCCFLVMSGFWWLWWCILTEVEGLKGEDGGEGVWFVLLIFFVLCLYSSFTLCVMFFYFIFVVLIGDGDEWISKISTSFLLGFFFLCFCSPSPLVLIFRSHL